VPSQSVPQQIGAYRIIDLLGEGAMGLVYLAERRSEIRQLVALKVIKLGMDSKEVLARFDLERQALAVMNHDAIAKIFDAGTTPTGQPFFVMERVEGAPLARYCDDHRLSIRERIALIQQICAGVEHAHQKGVLHRDLKPGNILVCRKDDRHVAKIIDFGLARATNRQLVQQTVLTEEGRMLGTPEYMSPEQALGNDVEIDTRTDIYSLGAILYEQLSGQLPFPTERLRRLGLLEIQRTIREEDPPRPSTRIGASKEVAEHAAERRRTDPEMLRADLRSDLDWIVMKALSKEPERRYASVGELSKDLENYLGGMPVIARPPSTSYRLSRFVRRNKVQVAAGIVVLLVATIGSVVSLLFAGRAGRLAADYARLLVGAELDAFDYRAAAAQPAWPEQVGELQQLVELGERLLEQLPAQADFMAMRRAGHATTGAARRDPQRGPHPEGDLHWRLAYEADLLTYQIRDTGASALAKAAGERELERVRVRIAEVEDRIRLSNSVELADDRERFLYDLIESQQARLRRVAEETLPDLRFRLAQARGIQAASIDDHQARWVETIEAIAATPRYGGLRLKPQAGLVPLGQDPRSLLFEFGHIPSGQVPTRDGQTGALQFDAAPSMVFVLIPPGSVRFGFCDGMDPNGREPDLQVGAFFLSKYELSRAQWERLANGVSGLRLIDGGVLDLRNRFDEPDKPANGITWNMAEALLRRHGLVLPTEVEWEYACKAGTISLWYTGNDPGGLLGHANLGDAELDDGVRGLTPVVKLAANPFGLHQILGNVVEWCSDCRDGSPGLKALRGGSWERTLDESTSTKRDHAVPTLTTREIGLRPARRLFE
jgi:serine/threonine protein kinase/formylglycine-generating enzyme required for sulfatase activity